MEQNWSLLVSGVHVRLLPMIGTREIIFHLVLCGPRTLKWEMLFLMEAMWELSQTQELRPFRLRQLIKRLLKTTGVFEVVKTSPFGILNDSVHLILDEERYETFC